jgi:uncharacterized protein (TIGR02099 family)
LFADIPSSAKMPASPRYMGGFILRPTFFLLRIVYRLFIFFLLIFGFSNYWMPLIAGYKHAVEAEAGNFLDNVVSIGDIYYDYSQNQPRWVLHNVRLYDKNDKSKLIKIAELSMSLDSSESLRTIRFQPAEIRASGVEASIIQNQKGEFHLNGLHLPIAGLSSGVGRKKPLIVQLENSTLHWLNLKNNKKLSFYNVNAKGEVTAKQITAILQATPPRAIGKPLHISANLQQHVSASTPVKSNDIKYWDGVVKLRGEINDPSALPIDLQKFTGIIDGDLEFQLESKISKNRPIQLDGKLNVKQPVLEQALHSTATLATLYHQNLDNILIDGHWASKPTYWEAQFLLEIEKNQRKQRSKLDFSQQLTDQGFQLNASVDSIDLDHYLPLLERQQWLNNKIAYFLRNLKPRGQLKDFSLYLDVDKQQALATQIRGKGIAKNLSIQAYKKVPAFKKMNAEFDFNRDTGSIYLYSNTNQVNYPRWFSAPIPINQFSTHISWQKTARQWHFFLKDFAINNADVQVHGSGLLKLDNNNTPWIDLNMEFSGRRTIKDVKRYIPAFLPDKGEKWLKTAIKSALVPQGGLKLKGYLKQFPFQNNKAGEFLTWFDVEQGRLAYLPHWPEIKKIKGRVSFINAGMQAKITSANILKNHIDSANIQIANFRKNPRLVIDNIHSTGDFNTQLAIIKQSPLGKNINKFLQKNQFSGKSSLKLAIQVPLKKGQVKKENVKIKGSINFNAVKAEFSPIKQRFDNIKGIVNFDQHGLSSQGLSTQYKNQTANISIQTTQDKQQIKLVLQQSNSIKQLLGDKINALSAYLSGKSLYTATLTFPSYSLKYSQKQRDKNKKITLDVYSDLVGIRSHLPKPFDKSAEKATDFTLSWYSDLSNSNENQHYTIEYNHLLKAVFDNAAQPRIAMNLGSPPIKLPSLPTSGINVEGQIKSANLSEWHTLLTNKAKQFNAKKALQFKLNLSIKQLFLAKASQGKAYLSINAKNDYLHANLKTDNLNAKINKSKNSWDIKLNKLNIDLLNSKHRNHLSDLSPNQFSKLSLECQNCQFKSQKLDKLVLKITNQDNNHQAKIQLLQILSPYYQFIADGDWIMNKIGQQKTQLNINTAKIANLGKFIQTFHKDTMLKEGNTTITGNLNWLGHPFKVDPYKIFADLGIKIQKGEFSDINIGMGKLLGLFNRSKLSKRLRLDFSDMSKQGILFDRITGDIHLEKGIAHTKNTLIESAVMLAGIKGQSNFLNHTHNQIVTVIPDAKSSLPAIGLLLGGVGVGAALALIDKVTDKYEKKLLKNDKVGMRYHIHGSWKKPQISDINLPTLAKEF